MPYYETPAGPAKQKRMKDYTERVSKEKVVSSAKKSRKPKPAKKKRSIYKQVTGKGAKSLVEDLTGRKEGISRLLKKFGLHPSTNRKKK